MNRKTKEQDDNGQEIVKYVPTGTISILFSGWFLPKEIKIFGLPMKVIPYVEPVIQCLNCMIFGHTTTHCKSKIKCKSCSKIHDSNIQCEKFCMYYRSGIHQSNSPKGKKNS